MNNNNIENFINRIMTNITDKVILSGIAMCFLSIIIAVYFFIKYKKGNRLKKIKKYIYYMLGGGVVLGLSGMLIYFAADYNIDFSSYKIRIPAYMLWFLLLFIGLNNGKKKTEKETEKETEEDEERKNWKPSKDKLFLNNYDLDFLKPNKGCGMRTSFLKPDDLIEEISVDDIAHLEATETDTDGKYAYLVAIQGKKNIEGQKVLYSNYQIIHADFVFAAEQKYNEINNCLRYPGHAIGRIKDYRGKRSDY